MISPSTWEVSTEHPGYRVQVIQDNGCTMRIFRPELTPEEQAKRVARVKAAAERVLKEYYKRKEARS